MGNLISKLASTAAASTIALASTSLADTLYVDDNAPNDPAPFNNSISDPLEDGTLAHPYDAIQEAIVAANTGDEIQVREGTYFETIDFLGKPIHLYSSDGRGNTTIDAQGSGSVVTCANGEGLDTILEGFTIAGGGMLSREEECATLEAHQHSLIRPL